MRTDETRGQCLCRKVNITISGEPQFSILCYCKDCQKISGGGHLPQVAIQRSNIEIKGNLATLRWKSEAGNDLHLSFCRDCGSPIFKSTSKMPDTIFVSVGLLDRQEMFTVPNHAFLERRQSWDLSCSDAKVE